MSYMLYRLLTGARKRLRRFFFSAPRRAVVRSCMASDIQLGIREWNPTPIVFFSLIFVFLSTSVKSSEKCDNRTFLYWVFLGCVCPVIVSLHATTLYITPIIFMLVAAAFIFISREKVKAIVAVLVSIGTFAALLTPYWIGEMKRGWLNSNILLYSSDHAVHAFGFVDKIHNAFLSYVWLDGQGYFLGGSGFLQLFGLFFLLAIIPLCFLWFKGNRHMFFVLCCGWIVFLCEAAVQPATEVRYRLPIVVAPIFLTISACAFLQYRSFRRPRDGSFLGKRYTYFNSE